METVLQHLEQIENILTLIAIIFVLSFVFLAWHILMTWLYYKNDESEKYKKHNLEFLDRRIENEMNYLRRLYTDNACNISNLKDEIQIIKNKVGKKK